MEGCGTVTSAPGARETKLQCLPMSKLTKSGTLNWMRKAIFDFDGTLAQRPGRWSQCMVEVLDELIPGNVVTSDDIRPFLRDGFPWHAPDVEHLHLSTPDLWWDNLTPLLRNAYEQVGVTSELMNLALTEVRRTYCDPSRFDLFPDVVDALSELRGAGWRVTILSNHVPELRGIVNGLGLGDLIDEVFSSALIGYEKPHPCAFKIAIGLSNPDECLMIGDDRAADVLGAEQFGIRAILVRESSEPQRSPIDVRDAVELILSEERL